MPDYYDEHKPEKNTCKAMKIVNGDLVVCEGALVETIVKESGQDCLVEQCSSCGAVSRLQPVILKENVAQRTLSDDLFGSPMQYLLKI